MRAQRATRPLPGQEAPLSGALAWTRSRRGTGFGHIGQQRHLPGPLDRDRQLPLVLAARSGHPRAADLAPIGYVAPQLVHVLVIDLAHLVPAEEARLALERLPRTAGATRSRSRGAVQLRSRFLRGHQASLQSRAGAGKELSIWLTTAAHAHPSGASRIDLATCSAWLRQDQVEPSPRFVVEARIVRRRVVGERCHRLRKRPPACPLPGRIIDGQHLAECFPR